MSEIIAVSPEAGSPEIRIIPSAEQTKQEFLELTGRVREIVDISGRDKAINLASDIKTHLKKIEASRQEVLKPFHDITRQINQVARDHTLDLDLELRRVNTLVGQFEEARQKELEKEQIALAAKAAEISKSVPETLELAGDVDKAEQLRRTLEMEQKAAELQESLSKVDEQKMLHKPRGGALRKDWDIKVTDIKGLYAAHPQCVTLSANMLAIKDLLKAGIIPAGVIATPKVAYSARAR